ncbi:MAG: Trk family potassium uptake protein [Elusimicrobia bacterium]|jgi:trk system potassium uptake protein TrkH|nr:Trk family potassium uptake protein [Elusimicrobiota bacterium]
MQTTGKTFNPSVNLIKLFLTVIGAGALALKFIPGTTVSPINFIDALFTSTSAVCVTGLTVKATGEFFTPLGQAIILFLIQIGALGYMALASMLVILSRKGMSIKGRIIVQHQMAGTEKIKLSKFILRVLAVTLILEAAGAALLTWRMRPLFNSFGRSLYFGVFHSVSAFCNAGFDIFEAGASLTGLNNDWISVMTVSFLIILGGIGYIVINDFMGYIKSLSKKKRYRFSVHTKIVLTATSILLVAGTVIYFIAEFNNPLTLKDMSLSKKWLMAFFQSVTPRTAGFNMIDTGGLLNFSVIFTVVLMFIGASPGGTGGGIKTTTFAVLLFNMKATIKEGRDQVLFKRRLTINTVKKSVVIFGLSIFSILIAMMLISFVDNFSIREILFEVTSAFGTVGLSTGITADLSSFSKLVIILTMFFGRLGPITFFTAIIVKHKKQTHRYPEQEIAVG